MYAENAGAIFCQHDSNISLATEVHTEAIK
jgi:hypothetical protein